MDFAQLRAFDSYNDGVDYAPLAAQVSGSAEPDAEAWLVLLQWMPKQVLDAQSERLSAKATAKLRAPLLAALQARFGQIAWESELGKLRAASQGSDAAGAMRKLVKAVAANPALDVDRYLIAMLELLHGDEADDTLVEAALGAEPNAAFFARLGELRKDKTEPLYAPLMGAVPAGIAGYPAASPLRVMLSSRYKGENLKSLAQANVRALIVRGPKPKLATLLPLAPKLQGLTLEEPCADLDRVGEFTALRTLRVHDDDVNTAFKLLGTRPELTISCRSAHNPDDVAALRQRYEQSGSALA